MPLIKPTRGMLLNKSHPLARGLVGCWLMNEGTGNKVFDLSGNGNTGAFVNSPVWVPGQSGSAIDFVLGDADYINLSDFTLAGATQITIVASVKGTWSTGLHAICAKYGSTDATKQFYFVIYQKDLRLVVQTDATHYIIEQGDTNLLNNVQYQIAGVWKGEQDAELYINGVQDGSTLSALNTPTTLQTVTENALIAARDDGVSGKTTAIIDYVIIYNRALSASEIALLYREPFCMFERAWRPELTGGQIVNLAGTSTALSSLSTTAKALRKIAGTAVGTSNTTAALSSIRGLLPEMERSWLAEALFNGMSANAFKLGTTLSMGWFWTRVAGCSVLYRGSSMGEIDFAKVLAVSERDSSEVSPPSYLSHYGGADGTSTYFYVIRRFNSCGCQEHTLAAAVKVSIESKGELAQPQPNSIFSSKVEHRNSNKIRLVWFYCPLEQKSQPVSFNVYYDDRTGQIDYQNPLASIGYKGRKFYSFQSDELDSGRYLFAIRAEGPEGLENSSLAQLKIELNTTSLDVINILSAEAV